MRTKQKTGSMLELWIGLTIGNFIYQGIEYFFTEEYKVGEAVKLSFFQGVALFLAATVVL